VYLLFTVNARGYSYIMKYKCQISVAVGTATLRLMFAGEEAGAWGCHTSVLTPPHTALEIEFRPTYYPQKDSFA